MNGAIVAANENVLAKPDTHRRIGAKPRVLAGKSSRGHALLCGDHAPHQDTALGGPMERPTSSMLPV
jgi:hypothetical protein